jgi:hypothetical protein
MCLVVITALASLVYAVDTDFVDTGDSLWSNPANWTMGLPTAADWAKISNLSSLHQHAIITGGFNAVSLKTHIGYTGGGTLTVDGGSLTTVGDDLLLGKNGGSGTLIMISGTINCGKDLEVGGGNPGIINMTGGTINIARDFDIPETVGSAAEVHLDGGTIVIDGVLTMSATGSMDITGGTLVINGNVTTAVSGYVSSGWITAYDGTGTVLYDTTTNPGKTTVTATPDVVELTVPDVTGIPLGIAESTIVAAGLAVGTVTEQVSSAFDPGDVISQVPAGGTSVPFGTSTIVDLIARPAAGDGDVDRDGNVNKKDILLFVAEWLDSDPDLDADFSRDGNVDMDDLRILSAHWLDNSNYSQTLTGKIMCGYQGWFNAPGDGAGRGWVHWGVSGRFEPGYSTVDWWPDMSEYGADEKFLTGFQYLDGSPAYVFSSYNQKTVLRHFQWMADYGIDGVFLQRFANGVSPGTTSLNHKDQVMLHCRKGANKYKRAWAMMYDLSSNLSGPELKNRVINDWRHLVDTYQITKNPTDAAYLHHNGKPVVAVWGLGFERAYEGEGTRDIIDFLKNDPVYGGCTIMIGVDNKWRERKDTDPFFGDIVQMADIISPWAVGRYGSLNPSELDNFVTSRTMPDQVWCNLNGKDYLPVVFPGFSWYNLKHILPDYTAVFDSRPRLGGTFLWRQIYKNINDAGCTMIYQAMFDEVDEGTAIFKISNSPPVSEEPTSYSNPFLPIGNAQYAPYDISDALLPSDHYLWLVGEGTKMLRGQIPLSETMPIR